MSTTEPRAAEREKPGEGRNRQDHQGLGMRGIGGGAGHGAGATVGDAVAGNLPREGMDEGVSIVAVVDRRTVGRFGFAKRDRATGQARAGPAGRRSDLMAGFDALDAKIAGRQT